jgi:hypothetical protein
MINIIDSLDINIKNKIKLNYIYYGVAHKTNYNKYIINKKYDKLENIIKSGVIDKESYYDKCEKIIVDNFECIKLKKNMNIYFLLPGFFTDKKINKYRENKNLITFMFFSKYHAYNNARLINGGILCYKVTHDIILIDFYNKNNIKLIIDGIYKDKINDQYINDIIYSTGYNITLKQYIEYINKNNSNIFIYDKFIPS